MAKPRKNSTSIDFTPELKAEARQRLIQGQTTRQIKAALPAIKNGQQLNGLRRELLKEAQIEAHIRAKDKANPLPEPTPKLVSIVDRTLTPNATSQGATGSGTPVTFTSSRIESSPTANMTQPRTGGSIFAWRVYPVNLAGVFGPLPYPYNPDSLGRMGGEGTYDVKISHPTGLVESLRETVPQSYGPARNPSYHSEANMAPVPVPPVQSAAETIKAVGDVMSAVNGFGGGKKDGAVEQATADMIRAQTAQLGKPVSADARALSIDDYIRMEQTRQAAHDKRMEEIRAESEASSKKIKADADAAVAKMKAESDAAIAKANADAAIKAANDKAQFDRMRELEKDDMTRRDKEMRKALEESNAAVVQAKADFKAELADARVRDKTLNDANFKILEEQGKSIVAVARINGELITAKASQQDSTIKEIFHELQPIIKQVVDAGTAQAAIANPAGAAAAAAIQSAANAKPGEATVTSGDPQADSLINTPEFKAFMADYADSAETYLEWQDEIALAAKNGAPTPDHAGKYSCDSISFKVASLALGGAPVSRVLWTSVVDFINKKKWEKMRVLIGGRLTDEQKKIVDDPRHKLFYETFRAKTSRTVATDFATLNQNMVLQERAYAPDTVQHVPPTEAATQAKPTEEATV